MVQQPRGHLITGEKAAKVFSGVIRQQGDKMSLIKN
jgi:hypothetical protein